MTDDSKEHPKSETKQNFINTVQMRFGGAPHGMPVRVLIHMGIGCVVYTIVSYAVGWVGSAGTIAQGIILAAIQLAIAFVIWFLFMMHYRAEAKKMNEKLQAMK